MTKRICKDCGPGAKRPAPHPGPRCATHHRAARKASKDRAHETYVQTTYGLRPGDYARLYRGQGGRCWICQRATGATRRLSVDHDHRCCPGRTSCGRCVRGLLCRPCNDLLGHVRNDTDTLYRALWYLANPPAREIIGIPNTTMPDGTGRQLHPLGDIPPSAEPRTGG